MLVGAPLFACFAVAAGASTGPHGVFVQSQGISSKGKIPDMEKLDIKKPDDYEFDAKSRWEQLQAAIGIVDEEKLKSTALLAPSAAIPGSSELGSSIGMFGTFMDGSVGDGINRVLIDCSDNTATVLCYRAELAEAGDGGVLIPKYVRQYVREGQAQLNVQSSSIASHVQGGESASVVKSMESKAGLGVTISSAVASGGIGGAMAWASMDSRSSGLSEMSASTEVEVYSLGMNQDAFTLLALNADMGREVDGKVQGVSPTAPGATGRPVSVSVFDSSQLTKNFKNRKRALPVAPEAMEAVSGVLQDEASTVGAVSVPAVRAAFDKMTPEQKRKYFLFVYEFGKVRVGVTVGGRRELVAKVQETSSNHEARRQYAVGLTAGLSKSMSLQGMQGAVGADKNLSETHKTTITSPLENEGSEKLVTEVEREYLADAATSESFGQSNGQDYGKFGVKLSASGSSSESSGSTTSAMDYHQQSVGGDTGAAVQAASLPEGNSGAARWLATLGGQRMGVLREVIAPIATLLKSGDPWACRMIRRIGSMPVGAGQDHLFEAAELCFESGAPAPLDGDAATPGTAESARQHLVRMLARTALVLVAAEKLQKGLAETAVDGHVYQVLTRRMEDGAQFSHEECSKVLMPLAVGRREAVRALLGDDVAHRVTLPDCESASGTGKVGGAGGLTAEELNVMRGSGEGGHARSDECAAMINILVGKAVHGKSMACRDDVDPGPPKEHTCAAIEALLASPIGPGADKASSDQRKAHMCSLLPAEQQKVAGARLATNWPKPVMCGEKGKAAGPCPATVLAHLLGFCTATEASVDTSKDLELEAGFRNEMGKFYREGQGIEMQPLATLKEARAQKEYYLGSSACMAETFTGLTGQEWPELGLPVAAGAAHTGAVVGIGAQGQVLLSRPAPPFGFANEESQDTLADEDGVTDLAPNKVSALAQKTTGSNVLAHGVGAAYKMPSRGQQGSIHVEARLGASGEAFTALRQAQSGALAFPSQEEMSSAAVHQAPSNAVNVFMTKTTASTNGEYPSFLLLATIPTSCDVTPRKYSEPFTLRAAVNSERVFRAVVNTGMPLIFSSSEEGDIADKVTASKGAVQVHQIVSHKMLWNKPGIVKDGQAVGRYLGLQLPLDPEPAPGVWLDALRLSLGNPDPDHKIRRKNREALQERLSKLKKESKLKSLENPGRKKLLELEQAAWVSELGQNAWFRSYHVKGGPFTLDGGKKIRSCVAQ